MNSENQKLALDTIMQKEVKGIPSHCINIMEHSAIESLAQAKENGYRENPIQVYLKCQLNIGTCIVDQWIPKNPLSIKEEGYDDSTKRGATTGAEEIICDGMLIDSPETVVEHMEKFLFPGLQNAINEFDEASRAKEILSSEMEVQETLGPNILKTGYGFISFPTLAYVKYGYENYLMAYALYPELMERHFSLQADLASLNNTAAARAYSEGNLPPLYRLDHDMADSRGTLVDIKSLDKIWFPHFAKALEPVLKGGIKLIWHCDGNLMQMLPRLLEAGLKGFQGFQYEDGMDYEKICKMKSKDGSSLIIRGGVSVTTTLPFGKPSDVKNEMKWLVDNGPKTGLILSVSSSVAPGTPFENIKTLVEGLKYYREHGRS